MLSVPSNPPAVPLPSLEYIAELRDEQSYISKEATPHAETCRHRCARRLLASVSVR